MRPCSLLVRGDSGAETGWLPDRILFIVCMLIFRFHSASLNNRPRIPIEGAGCEVVGTEAVAGVGAAALIGAFGISEGVCLIFGAWLIFGTSGAFASCLDSSFL